MSTEQEEFWRGEFGDRYTARCTGIDLIRNNTILLWNAFHNTGLMSNVVYALTPGMGKTKMGIPTVVEFGANRGLNIMALHDMGWPYDKITAVEINYSACEQLRKLEGLNVFERTMFEDRDVGEHEIVISSGLLIHIAPGELEDAYDVLHSACKSGGYIFLCEYFASTPTEVSYRGHANKLWRRNYGKDMLLRYDDLSLVDYGFVADIDPVAPKDNVNWWLLGKKYASPL